MLQQPHSLTPLSLQSPPPGDGGYPFTPQQLALSAEGAKTASKYGEGDVLH